MAHLVRLIDDLLDGSRISRGTLHMRLERTDLAVAVAQAVETVSPLVTACGHVLVVRLPEESVSLDADPERLAQVFANWAVRRHGFFVRRARAIVARNRAVYREALERMPALHDEVPAIGNVVFPHSDVDVRKLERLLVRKYRTVIAPGRFFAAREMRDHFRLGLGGKTPTLRRGLANLRRALRELT